MSIRVEKSNAEYLQFKEEVLTFQNIVRIDVNIADLQIDSLKEISFGGQTLKLNKQAIAGLAKALGISQKFVDSLKKGLGAITSASDQDGDGAAALLNLVIKALKGKKTSTLTLSYNKRFKEITNIYPEGTKLVQDDQYFIALESVIEKTDGAFLRNINQSSNGDLHSVIANPKLEFQFGNMKNELFTSGITLDLTAHQMGTSFFTERLVCANGMSVRDKLCSKYVNTNGKVPDFLTGILSSEYQLDSIQAFRKRLNRNYHTMASLGEVLKVERYINAILGGHALNLTSDMSVHNLRLAFGESYLNDKENHKYLRTNVTLWELINEITAISSKIEQQRLDISENSNLKLQKLGGTMMFQKPDLIPSNIKQLFLNKIIH
jgi:hypothetical protein